MLTDYDISLADAFKLILPPVDRTDNANGSGRVHVLFQFPPKVISDAKGASWEEGEQRGSEPLAYYTTTGARKIRLEWTYIVGEAGWGVNKIRTQVAAVRTYFHNLQDQGGTHTTNLIAHINLVNHGDPNFAMTARLLDVDIKHGKTYFIPQNVLESYPLRTDVGVELRLWSKAGQNKSEEKVALDALINPVPVLWR